MSFSVQHDPGNIGRLAVVVHEGKCFVGTVLDQISGTITPKRIRLRNDLYLQGKVLMPDQYDFKGWDDDAD